MSVNTGYCRVTGPGNDGDVLLHRLAPGRRLSRTILPECAPKCYIYKYRYLYFLFSHKASALGGKLCWNFGRENGPSIMVVKYRWSSFSLSLGLVVDGRVNCRILKT